MGGEVAPSLQVVSFGVVDFCLECSRRLWSRSSLTSDGASAVVAAFLDLRRRPQAHGFATARWDGILFLFVAVAWHPVSIPSGQGTSAAGKGLIETGRGAGKLISSTFGGNESVGERKRGRQGRISVPAVLGRGWLAAIPDMIFEPRVLTLSNLRAVRLGILVVYRQPAESQPLSIQERPPQGFDT